MVRLRMMSSGRLTTLLLGCLALLLVICIIVFPDQAFQSSLQGLSIWWKLVFPALLPFLIITEILSGMGILHGLGALLEPLLRLLFKLPGIGGWAIATGLTAGAPSGVIAVGGLRRDKLVTRDEAERLLTLSHVLSPVFLITVVGVGFLQNAKAGLVLAILHYGSVILIAVFQRLTFVRTIAEPEVVTNRRAEARSQPRKGLFNKSISDLQRAQAADGRTFGKLLGDSVVHSVQHLMAVGGLIMIFSVLIHAISLSQIIPYVSMLFSNLGLDSASDVEQLLSSVMPGLFEAHLGAYTMGQNLLFSDPWQYAVLSALFAWGGLSTHAQVKSFTIGTDIRYSAFLRTRLLHSVVAFISTGTLWHPIASWIEQSTSPVFLSVTAEASNSVNIHNLNMWPLVSPMMVWFSCIVIIMLFLSVFTAFVLSHSDLKPHKNKR
ncbi:nucleoside recognition domain-containing protein [Paenibacillus radicis (ex Xue et al. 2023)]|uniref:Sporulation protein n=1 Tax=Paenibacillus radicis (ex Xue et al. 2023) TaxID=2972489 RepID=A0ABT1YCD3_9BACL|nr:nucleoside recognition domain-containing protein [Paenibacillus radicis (ex Xue et al. 2023)]MCR8630859.1 sporulation protein [Paenibacillus radicis (ex Xue et al. 2023)]